MSSTPSNPLSAGYIRFNFAHIKPCVSVCVCLVINMEARVSIRCLPHSPYSLDRVSPYPETHRFAKLDGQ